MAGEIEGSLMGEWRTLALAFFIFIAMALIAYVYQSLTLYYIARKTKAKNNWLAWIPIGNLVLMANIAQMPWWPVLLYVPAAIFMYLAILFSILGNILMDIILTVFSYLIIITVSVYTIIWHWKIYERVSRPGYWSVVPVALSIMGVIVFFFGLALNNPPSFWIGTLVIILGIVQQYVYMGIAAWHKDSINRRTHSR